jgi:hypothetical protein
VLAATATIAVAGCQQDEQATPPVAVHPAKDGGNAVYAHQLDASAAGDPSAGRKIRIVQLDVYQLVVPLGAISRSEEFWKHVDEQSVDVGTYDLLRKNGWRVGMAPTGEWNYFHDIIETYPASSKPSALSASAVGGNSSMELSMKTAVPYQNVFYFNDVNALYGRTFERCDNLLNVTLQQVPRKPGVARVTVCPTVRSLRRRFEVTMKNDERVIEYVHPEHLYDLNLQTDIPAGQFLVLAPSPEVKWKTSLGATFLVQDAAAERLETVILLVPHAVEMEETTTRPPAVPAR